jgi:cytochrome c oxidase subunit I+III
VFAYFYFWTVSASWPPPPFDLPASGMSLLAALGWALTSAVLTIAHRRLRANASRSMLSALLVGAIAATWLGFALQFEALSGANVKPDQHAYGAVLYTMLAYQGLHVVLVTLMGGYTIARILAGLVDDTRRNTFDNTRLMWYYTAAQALVSFLVMHAPRLA